MHVKMGDTKKQRKTKQLRALDSGASSETRTPEPRIISFIDDEEDKKGAPIKSTGSNNGNKNEGAKRKLKDAPASSSKRTKPDGSSEGGAVLSKAERKEERRRRNLQWKAFTNKSWNDVDPNPRHTLYYKKQFPDLVENGEWSALQRCLGTELPVTFRLCPHRGAEVARAMRHRIDSKFRSMTGRFVAVRGEVLSEVVSEVPWCEDTYQINADSRSLSHVDGLEELYNVITRECALGHLVRQELVSMIPALMLDVAPSHLVLDMCAAPGSKTEQLLGFMNARNSTGMVVANDADMRRISLLRNRFSRFGSPNLLVTCCRAQELRMRFNSIQFDRVLCDVPCTGDGTFRKAAHLWRAFRPRKAVLMHPLQLEIATASAGLLKSGGRMVYSTCSLNQIENESVVAALLRLTFSIEVDGRDVPHALKLLDPKEVMAKTTTIGARNLKALKWRPGVSSWHCDLETMQLGESAEDAGAEGAHALSPDDILPTMAPPSEEEARSFNLHYTMRLFPHDQDTGGFYVAVLEMRPISKSELKARSQDKTSEAVSKQTKRQEYQSGGPIKSLSLKQVGFNVHHMAIAERSREEMSSSERKALRKWIAETGAQDMFPEQSYAIDLPSSSSSTAAGAAVLMTDEIKDEASMRLLDFVVDSCGIPRKSGSQAGSAPRMHLVNTAKVSIDDKTSGEIPSVSLMSSSVFETIRKTGWRNGLVVQAGVAVASSSSSSSSSSASSSSSPHQQHMKNQHKEAGKRNKLLLAAALEQAVGGKGSGGASGRRGVRGGAIDGDTAQYLFNITGARLIALDEDMVCTLLGVNSQRPGAPFVLDPPPRDDDDDDDDEEEEEDYESGSSSGGSSQSSPFVGLLQQLDLSDEDLEALAAGERRFVGVHPRGSSGADGLPSHDGAPEGGDADEDEEEEKLPGKPRMSKAERKRLKKGESVASTAIVAVKSDAGVFKGSGPAKAPSPGAPSLRMVVILELCMAETSSDGEFGLQCRVVTPEDRAASYLDALTTI